MHELRLREGREHQLFTDRGAILVLREVRLVPLVRVERESSHLEVIE